MLSRRGAASLSAAILALASACATSTTKPVPSAELEKKAIPALATYLSHALVGKVLDGKPVKEARLTGAKLFDDGLYHESWRLETEVDGRPVRFALKIYPDIKAGLLAQSNYNAARKYGWPLPAEIHWGADTMPHSRLPSLLMEYVEQPTLAKIMRERWGKGEPVDVAQMAAYYGTLGQKLGELHRASLRIRQPSDLSGKLSMDALVEKCTTFRWCGPGAMKRFQTLGAGMDTEKVAFVHGDLYEIHVAYDENGQLTRFFGMHDAEFADPGWDLGAVLLHTLVINPISRDRVYGVARPTDEELKATATAFLDAYRESAGIMDDEAWRSQVERAKGYMWLRLGYLLTRLKGNAHAEEMLSLVDEEKLRLFVIDPLARLEIKF